MRLLIGELIESKGLKKIHVAKQLGVNENTITNWIHGRSMPKLDQAVNLAEILDCDVNDLFEHKKG